ncbi:acyltransferase [Streptomyces sp. Y2F8-2]|uniref:acyltransferase family protein n=1 Tax=unclassified Streptomyces TaxID=2593676 RepID=UPI001904DDF9|nr:acyltransferase [Streptomyces sp. Y2F8-2]GHJ99921.1 acyltransferase [Streptomyces sp. Y2F8-2]
MRPAARQLTFIAAARLLPSFCILASHLSFERVFRDPTVQETYYRIFNPAGFNAVSFFIVLSGFILTWISAERPPGRGFRARRLLRILPVHFITWAVIVCAFAATFPATGLFATLTLEQSWFPDHGIYWAANAPAWTLTTELVLYAVFPTVYRFLSRQGDRFLFRLLAGLVAVVVLLPVVLQLLPDGARFANAAFTERGHLVQVSEWKYWLVYVFPLTRVLEALCGVVICLLVLRGRWTRNALLPTALLVLAVVVEELWAPILLDLTALTIIPIVLLIGALAAREIARWNTPGAKESRAVTRISAYGKYTFGIYMYQWALILICQRYVHPWGNSVIGGVLFIAAFYALCLTVSMISYRFVETPVNRFMKPAIAAHAKR